MSEEDDFESEVRRQHAAKLAARTERRHTRKATRASTSQGLSMIERQALELASRTIAEDGNPKKMGEYNINAPSEASSVGNDVIVGNNEEEESGGILAAKTETTRVETQGASGRDFMGTLSKDMDSDEDIEKEKKKAEKKAQRRMSRLERKEEDRARIESRLEREEEKIKVIEAVEAKFDLEAEKNLSSKNEEEEEEEEATVVKGSFEAQVVDNAADGGDKDDDFRAALTTNETSGTSRVHHQNALEVIEDGLSCSIEQIHTQHVASHAALHQAHTDVHKQKETGTTLKPVIPTIDHASIAAIHPLSEENVQAHAQETRQALLVKLEHLKELKAAKMREEEIKREAEKLLAEREKNSPSQAPQGRPGLPQIGNGMAPPGEQPTYITLPVGARPPTGAVPVARVTNQPQGMLPGGMSMGIPPGVLAGGGPPPYAPGDYPPSYHQGQQRGMPGISDMDKTIPMYGAPTSQRSQQSQPHQSRNDTAPPHQQQHHQDPRYGHNDMHINIHERVVELESDEEGYGMGYKGPRIHLDETKEAPPISGLEASNAGEKTTGGKTKGVEKKERVAAKKKRGKKGQLSDSDAVAPASGYDHTHTIPLKLTYSSHDSKIKDGLLKVETTVLHGLVTVSAIDDDDESDDDASKIGHEYKVVAMFNCDNELHVVVMENKVILHTNTEAKNLPTLLKSHDLKPMVHLMFEDIKSAKQAAKAITSPVFANKPILRRDKRHKSPPPKGSETGEGIASVGGEPRPPSNAKNSALTKSPRRPSIKGTTLEDQEDQEEKKDADATTTEGVTTDDKGEEKAANEDDLDKSIAETVALIASPKESPDTRRKRLYDLHGSDSDESDGPATGRTPRSHRTATGGGVSEEKDETEEVEAGKRTFVSETSKLMFRKTTTSPRPKLSRKEQVQKFKERDREHIRKQQEIRNAARIEAEKEAKKKEYKDDLYKLKRDMLVDRFRSKKITEASINRTSLDGGSTLGPHEEVSVDHVNSFNYNRGLAPLVPVDSPETKRRRDQIRAARRIRKEEMQFIKGLEKIRLCDANRKTSHEVAKEVNAVRHFEREHKIAKLLHWENSNLDHTNKILSNKFKHSQDYLNKQHKAHSVNRHYNNVMRDFEKSKVLDVSGVEIGGSSSYYGNYMSKLVVGSTDNTSLGYGPYNAILEEDGGEEWGDEGFMNGNSSMDGIELGEGGFSSTDDEESLKTRRQRREAAEENNGNKDQDGDAEREALSLREQQQASYVDMTSSRATYQGFSAQESSYLQRFDKDKGGDYNGPGYRKKKSQKRLKTISMPANKDFGRLTASAIAIQRIMRGKLVRLNKSGYICAKAACVLQYWTLHVLARKRLLELRHYAIEGARERLYAGSIIGYFVYRHWRLRQRLKGKGVIEVFTTDVNENIKVMEGKERAHRLEQLVEFDEHNTVASTIETKREESVSKAERDKVRRQEKKEKMKEEKKEAKECLLMLAEEEALWAAKEIALMQAEDVELEHYLAILMEEGKDAKGSVCCCS